MANQKCTEELKKAAVKMVLESSETNAQISENINVKYKTLWSWVQKTLSKLRWKEKY